MGFELRSTYAEVLVSEFCITSNIGMVIQKI